MVSHHAQARMQQRAIPALLIDLLYRYGREHQQDGATVLFFDRQSRKRVKKALEDALQRFDKLGDTYLVESGETGIAITVGHRLQRLKRR